jgi:hypothetical protein
VLIQLWEAPLSRPDSRKIDDRQWNKQLKQLLAKLKQQYLNLNVGLQFSFNFVLS